MASSTLQGVGVPALLEVWISRKAISRVVSRLFLQRHLAVGGVGSARAVEAAQRRRWMWRRQLGGGGQRGGVSGGGRAAAAARHWRRHGGRGRGGGSPVTPATALPNPLLIAAARLGDVAVSLCGLRGSGGLLGGSSSSNVFYQYVFVVLCFGAMVHNLL